MDKLTPKNMFAVFHSKLVQDEMDAEPQKFLTERFYTKHFSVSKLDEDVLDKLSKVLPAENMRLTYPPINTYMPKKEDLTLMKSCECNHKPELL